MDPRIAQLVALAGHYNARSRKLAAAGFSLDHPACQACECVRFFQPRSAWLGLTTRWESVADDPQAWLDGACSPELAAYLVHEQTADPATERLSLGRGGGGGRWQLVVTGFRTMDCWESEWKRAGRDAPPGREWRVSYLRTQTGLRTSLPKTSSTKDLTVHLRRVLLDLYYLAQKGSLEEYAERFALAERCLSSDDPLATVGRRDLTPPGVLYRPAERLLACAHAGWVFGASETWSRLVFDPAAQLKHREWTDQLYVLLNEAICTAVNSSSGGAG